MKKRALWIILSIFIIIACIVSYLWAIGKTNLECDYYGKDCKLVYNSCDCEAMPKNWKGFLVNESICEVNRCIEEGVTAICVVGTCTRSDEKICEGDYCFNASEVK